MQIDDSWQAFSERLACQWTLHVAVVPCQPSADALARLNERNLQVLRALASLDERRMESGDEESPWWQEIQRVESKLDLLLDLVDRLVMPEGGLPPRQALSFNAVGAVLPSGLWAGQAQALLRLHFDRCRAMPLELLARMGRQLDAQTVFVRFDGLSEMVEEGLERLVFCHHRREVAEARASSVGENVSGIKSRM